MMWAPVWVALLALSSAAALTADQSCEELTKPLEDQTKVTGKWIYHVGTSDNNEFLNQLGTVNSSWIDISSTSADHMTLRWGDRMNGKCHFGAVNYTIEGNFSKTTFNFNSAVHEHIGQHIVSCPDCIMWTDNAVAKENGVTKKGRYLYLFTKTGNLEASDLEVFKKQAECFNFPATFYYGDNSDLCVEEKKEEQ